MASWGSLLREPQQRLKFNWITESLRASSKLERGDYVNRTRFSRFMYTTLLLLLGASLPLIGQQPGGGSSPSSMQQPAARPNINDPMNTTQNDTPQKMDDKKFLKEAAEGGLAEVELGKNQLRKKRAVLRLSNLRRRWWMTILKRMTN